MQIKKLIATGLAVLMSSTAISGVVAQPINENQLSDPRVRQAISYAIDMDTIAETIFEGAAIPADGLLPDGPNKPTDLNPYKYDPDKARALLAEAGWDSNRELDVVYYYADQATADLMAAMQAYLGDVGIKMNYRMLEGDIGSQISVVPEDPVNGPSAVTWDMLYGARAALALQEYFNRYALGGKPMIPNIDRMNELVAQVNGTTDPEIQREGYFEMERIINENVYQIPLYYQQLYTFESTRVNRNGAPYGNEQYNYNWGIENWTVEPDASGKAVMYTNTGPAQFFEVPWQNLGIFVANKFAFDTVLESDGDLTPIGGEMAETYSISEDGLTFTVTLKDGLKWHDGTDITGNDLAWSVGAALKFPITHPVVKSTLTKIEGAEAFVAGDADAVTGISVDGNTVTMKFAAIDPNVLLTFSQFAPLPAAQFEGVDLINLQQAPYWQKPIGSGPFKIDEVVMNDYTTLVAFEGYHKGTPKIEQIVASPSYENDANLLVNASAGKADFGYTKVASDVPALEALDHMVVHPINIPYTRMLWINQFPLPTK
ncbi:MAG: peptide ABC transporter substrate-binding protein [Devosia sp.]|uniref:ABC transporter substrate-binding protein n=1 Tax=unclassified Devosia TaxID=196773 RepID=UPI0019E42AFE|nr:MULTISPECIES: ABC transporter substrate-binding protein [unclassified Devosia]MBF0679841.1 peptide ABC transporter substrate-binding protein [Devosia sp.]WEJ34566.1 ABC transporter substrate-binding protein [Devosia sp. SD17-2]